jgi:hypothetical protein
LIEIDDVVDGNPSTFAALAFHKKVAPLRRMIIM